MSNVTFKIVKMNYGPCLERLVVGDRVGVKRTAEAVSCDNKRIKSDSES